MFGIHHSDGAGQRAAIDQEVELDKSVLAKSCIRGTHVNVDAGCSGCRIDNLFVAILPHTNISLLILVLFGNERRDVRFETASSDSHDDKAQRKDANGGIRLSDDLGNGREDEQDVADDRNNIGILDRKVATEVFVSKPRASKGCDVGPKLVD
jgi:hypothetical protein